MTQTEKLPLSEFEIQHRNYKTRGPKHTWQRQRGIFCGGQHFIPTGLHDDHQDSPWPLPRTSLKRSGWRIPTELKRATQPPQTKIEEIIANVS